MRQRTDVRPRRSRAVLAAAILTYIGAALLLLAALILLVGVRGMTFFGEPMRMVTVSGINVAILAAHTFAVVLVVLALVLVVLAVLTQRGNRVGRLGLTVVGVLVIGYLLYIAVINESISPLPSAAWIALPLILLWIGRSRDQHT